MLFCGIQDGRPTVAWTDDARFSTSCTRGGQATRGQQDEAAGNGLPAASCLVGSSTRVLAQMQAQMQKSVLEVADGDGTRVAVADVDDALVCISARTRAMVHPEQN